MDVAPTEEDSLILIQWTWTRQHCWIISFMTTYSSTIFTIYELSGGPSLQWRWFNLQPQHLRIDRSQWHFHQNTKVCCCIYHSLPQCTRLFNLSFISTGFLPDSWKTASIATSYPMQNQPRISRPLLITGQLERLVHAQAHVLVCSWQSCHTIDMDILVPLSINVQPMTRKMVFSTN